MDNAQSSLSIGYAREIILYNPILRAILVTHFQFLTFLARDLRCLANLKVYFSFVNVSDSLVPSSEHNCEAGVSILTSW